MALLPIPRHCAAISHVLASVEDAPDWEGVYDWLLVAASLVSVELDTIQHNPGYGWCSSADEFHDAREDLLRSFVRDLSIFSFAWGGLESALDIIDAPPHPDKSKRGKVGNACYLLDQAFVRRGHVLHLQEEVELFRVAAQRCIGYESVEKRLKKAATVGSAGAGLYAVYELRNLFAHGSLVFPMPDEENRPQSAHAEMVTHATRVVLLQIQMLLLAHFGESEEPISFASDPMGISQTTPLWKALRACHVEHLRDARQLEIEQGSDAA